MVSKKKIELEYIQVDNKNAILVSEENTQYIKEKIKMIATDPSRRSKIYAELAKRFALDLDKVNKALVLYVNKIRALAIRKVKPKPITTPKDLEKLCNRIGHKFVDIRLSHLRGYKECQRCGRVVTRYKIKGR